MCRKFYQKTQYITRNACYLQLLNKLVRNLLTKEFLNANVEKILPHICNMNIRT